MIVGRGGMQGALCEMGKVGKIETARQETGRLLQGAEIFIPMRIGVGQIV